MLKIFSKSIVLQEVPNEISLAFTVAGCPLNCPNCSWKNTIEQLKSFELNDKIYSNLLDKYKNFVSCILFMGGEWEKDDLINKLILAKKHNFKTCLYTGLELNNVDKNIVKNLDYIKTGHYNEKLGGLDSINTNQKFIDLKNNEILNKFFIKQRML